MPRHLSTGVALGLTLAALTARMGAGETPLQKGPMDPRTQAGRTELATFGGGCFWCLEAIFERLEGVRTVTSGYAGGHLPEPSYQAVCSGATGHAEVIQIAYDPARISFEQLLAVFWQAHDPTTLNRQGPDTGTQYRSIILYHDEAQKRLAERSKAAAATGFKAPIVTQIVPLAKFYPAEDYHQDYFRLNSRAAYCQAVIRPKLDKLIQHKVLPGPTRPAESPSPAK